MSNQGKKMLLYADSYGVYIPAVWFKQCYLAKQWSPNKRTGWIGLSKWARNILNAGPEHENYWEAWAEAEENCIYVDHRHTWSLAQSGDLWVYRDDYDWEEDNEED